MKRLILVILLFAACGGTAVIDGSSGSGSSSTTTGQSGCTSHDQCSGEDLCIFTTGECAPPCPGECGNCPINLVCDDCATSSSPDTKDCIAACVVAEPGQCDDHEDCATGEVCLYFEARCTPTCAPDGGCPDGLICDGCATSSCPCCADCGAACIEP